MTVSDCAKLTLSKTASVPQSCFQWLLLMTQSQPPFHSLEGWPWILILSLAWIRRNLSQTHILLQEICACFAPALFKKCKTRLLLNWNLWILTEWENAVYCGWLSWFFLIQTRSKWKENKLPCIHSPVGRKDFEKSSLKLVLPKLPKLSSMGPWLCRGRTE